MKKLRNSEYERDKLNWQRWGKSQHGKKYLKLSSENIVTLWLRHGHEYVALHFLKNLKKWYVLWVICTIECAIFWGGGLQMYGES